MMLALHVCFDFVVLFFNPFCLLYFYHYSLCNKVFFNSMQSHIR